MILMRPTTLLGSAASSRRIRAAALGGIVGPASFIAAWAAGAATTNRDYSSVNDAISRLAAVGADTRPLMTSGFIAFGVALPVYSIALRSVVRGPAWITAAATGLATLAVAAAPLDRSATLDTWHAIFAGLGYVTLAATPFLAAKPLIAAGHGALAKFGVALGSVSSVCLVLTTANVPTGLFQRLGLTATDLWIAASALAIATGRLTASD